MTLMIIGLVILIGTHLVRIVWPGFREQMITRLGKGPWRGIYSILALAGLAATIWGYGAARPETQFLYVLPGWVAHLVMLLMLISMILVAASLLPPGRIKQAVKHPLLIGTKTWAIAHLLVNGDTVSIILFGSLLMWAVLALISVKRRGEPDPVAESVMYDLAAVGAGIALWFAIVYGLHEWLIGVPVIV